MHFRSPLLLTSHLVVFAVASAYAYWPLLLVILDILLYSVGVTLRMRLRLYTPRVLLVGLCAVLVVCFCFGFAFVCCGVVSLVDCGASGFC